MSRGSAFSWCVTKDEADCVVDLTSEPLQQLGRARLAAGAQVRSYPRPSLYSFFQGQD